MKKRLLLLCLPLFFAACKKNNAPIAEPEKVDTSTSQPVVENADYTSEYTNNLNVVYFVPTDNPALPDYERRLSEILLAGQKFYGDEMQRNGYGNKTFGLLKNSTQTRVKIITIQGKLTKNSYTSSTYGNIIDEVNAYFAANPTASTGAHTLIICPDNGIDNPFFGVGKNCLAKDYAEFDIKYLGTTTYNFTKYYGGLMHELGHGLNLPHNHARESAVATLGTALMGSGNTTLGKTPTFLTEADCAILNTNQIFQKQSSITYYGPVTAGIKKMYAYYSAAKDAIIASGKFDSSVPVSNVTYYVDPNVNNEGVGVNKDYNAVTWRSNVIGTDSFYVELPLSELNSTYKNNPAELKVKLIHQNGNITNTTYNFNILNGIPDINILPPIDKTGWSVLSVSSQEPTYEASKVIDDNLSTFWFARFSQPAAKLPHNLIIDMGKQLQADGLTINQRQDVYRMVKNVEVLISADNVSWVSTGEYVVPNVKTLSKLPFDALKTFRYFKIIVKSNYDTVEPDKSCIAEVGIYKN